MAKPVLDLEILVERPIVNISGKPYEMRSPSRVSILDFVRIGKKANRITELDAKIKALDEEGVSELVTLLDELCRFVLEAPDEIHESLTDDQRTQIVSVFTRLYRESQATPAGAEIAPKRKRPVTDLPILGGS